MASGRAEAEDASLFAINYQPSTPLLHKNARTTRAVRAFSKNSILGRSGRSGGSFLGNRCGRFANVGDHDIRSVCGPDAFRVGDVSNVERIANLECGDVNLDGFWEVVWKAGDFDRVNVLFNEAPGFDTSGFTIEMGRDVGGDFGIFVDRTEISVQRDTG